jgi:hypothetical protein
MAMLVLEQDFEAPAVTDQAGLLKHFRQICREQVEEESVPVRFVVTATTPSGYHCELGSISGMSECALAPVDSVFEFRRRSNENTQQFNVVLLVPTGIGAEIGGHAGDAAPVARLLGGACDALITHPNAVNASDLNEMPENALYVEGSVLCRLLMGTVGLQRVRSNRILAVIDTHQDEMFVHLAINAINAARTAYGLDCHNIVQLDPSIRLTAEYSASGSAVGRIEYLERLCRVLDEHRNEYDAVAISSIITVPPSFHMEYFRSEGSMINPWGGVEAMLTHAISTLYNVPSAHSPMLETREIANADTGIVDPRMAAEAVSNAYLHCILKGLHHSPKIVTDPIAMWHHSVLTASDISCLIIPDGCLGLPTLAALQQGMKVIAVRENRNLMRNDLSALPWASGQFYCVENYWEAVGVMTALKAGVAPESVRRPFPETKITRQAGDVAADDLIEVGQRGLEPA